MRTLIVSSLLLMSSSSLYAADYSNELGAIFVDPHVAVGVNQKQGTTVLLGLDAGVLITDQLSAGVGAFGSFGEKAQRDREIGGGPFVRFIQPVTPFLTASIREDIDYVDQRQPFGDEHYRATGEGYFSAHGVVSYTTVGVHLQLARIIGVSAGYRAAVGLNTSDLGHGRSMPFVGFSVGI